MIFEMKNNIEQVFLRRYVKVLGFKAIVFADEARLHSINNTILL